MLMVIFGAGASYDSYPSVPAPDPRTRDFPDRPPLANQLFINDGMFRTVAEKWPKCLPLIYDLEPRSGAEVSIEETLERYNANADSETKSQLWAIRYYLRDVIRNCESLWQQRTNRFSSYSALFDQVRRSGPICFVTFNYDTLLEQSLAPFNLRFPQIENYISNPNCKIIKLHGSVDWNCWIPNRTIRIYPNNPSPEQLIGAAPEVPNDPIIATQNQTPPETQGELHHPLPALAIPVVSKSQFICPDDHVRALLEVIPHLTHIATIGWRAAEKHFLDILGRELKRSVALTSVCGSEAESQATLERLRAAGVWGRLEATSYGFTSFVQNHVIEDFVKSTA